MGIGPSTFAQSMLAMVYPQFCLQYSRVVGISVPCRPENLDGPLQHVMRLDHSQRERQKAGRPFQARTRMRTWNGKSFYDGNQPRRWFVSKSSALERSWESETEGESRCTLDRFASHSLLAKTPLSAIWSRFNFDCVRCVRAPIRTLCLSLNMDLLLADFKLDLSKLREVSEFFAMMLFLWTCVDWFVFRGLVGINIRLRVAWSSWAELCFLMKRRVNLRGCGIHSVERILSSFSFLSFSFLLGFYYLVTWLLFCHVQ